MPTYKRRWINARNHWLVGTFPRRAEYVAGAMLHCTRSGRANNPLEFEGTEGWWSNPNNKQGVEPNAFGSYADWLVDNQTGEQVQCTAVSVSEFAKWTAGYGNGNTWAAGHYYIQIEMCQALQSDGFTSIVIDSTAQLMADLAHVFKFPLTRLPYLTQTGTPPRGITAHDNCANGRVYGKSDPGSNFPWEMFLSKAQAYFNGTGDEEPMTPQERAEFEDLKMRNKRVENLVGGNGISSTGSGPVDLVGDAALAYADHPDNKWSALYGVNLARKEAADAMAVAKAAGGSDGIPEHAHDMAAGETGGVHRT